MTATLTDRLSAAEAHARATAPAAIQAGDMRVAPGLPVIAQTGYYGRVDAGERERVSEVHARLAGEPGPLCGSAIGAEMTFHFCSQGINRAYLTCRRCHRAAERIATGA